MKIVYFVHDVHDPAIRRRLTLLAEGGASDVTVLAFRRTAERRAELAGYPVIDLGRTHDARLTHRAKSVLLALARTPMLGRILGGADVVLARNLEMLAVASLARKLHAPRARLVYESLDIHRSLLGQGAGSKALRWIERNLARGCDQVMVSSPAFVEHYFHARQKLDRPTLLVENKMIETSAPPAVHSATLDSGPPWVVGWFGVLRCQRSLDTLCEAARRCEGRLKVMICGRPALHEFVDFHGQIAAAPGVGYWGPYDADQLPRLYAQVHLTWAIDFFEAGGNSDWLLPNRIYEGGRHGVPALALEGVEAGRWIREAGAGLTLKNPLEDLVALIDGLRGARYAALRAAVDALPRERFVHRKEDCRRITQQLAAQDGRAPPNLVLEEQAA